MHSKFQEKIDLFKKSPSDLKKIKTIEAYYRIREAMNRFDFGQILGIDYGGSCGPDSDEYDSEALAVLEYLEINTEAGRVLTKTMLYKEILKIHKIYFSSKGDSVRCRLIAEHVYNEIFRLDLYKLSKKSFFFNFYYKKMHACGWHDL